MKNKLITIIVVLLGTVLVLSPVHASEWKKVLQQDGITLSQRTLPGKTYKQLRGTALVQGKLASLVAILDNTSLCPQWLNDCRSSKTVKTISPAERIDYTVMDAPFLLEDRDMYIRSKISYDSRSRTATIQLRGLEKYDSGQAGRVRVLGLQGHWRFQQINEQQVKIDYLIYSNPQVTPASAVNASSPKGAMKTFGKFIRLASSPKFRNIKLDPTRLQAITVR